MHQINIYNTLEAGAKLLILGAVHGNETCGTVAIKCLIAKIESGDLILKKGQLTVVPVCNPRAYAENKRFIDRNLNRFLYPKNKHIHYEDQLDNTLCDLIQKADFVLDLHSYESHGDAFGFLGHHSDKELDFCLNLGIEKFVYGWSEAFATANSDPYASMGTTEYARQFGIPAVTIECGNHLDSTAPDAAYRSILKALQHLGMIDTIDAPQEAMTYQFTQMQKVFYKQKQGKLWKIFNHYDKIKAGEVIAAYEDGEQIIADADYVMVLPKNNALVGGEWFYLGKQTPCPDVTP